VEGSKRLDAIDGKILKILLKESRTSFTEIAKACKISVCAIRMRYNHLKSAGVIIGERVHINPVFWGYNYVADVRMEASLNDEEEVVKMLWKKRYVLGAARFGRNIMCFVALSKLDNLRNIVEEIESDPRLNHVNTLIWTDTRDISHPENLIIRPFSEVVEKTEKVKAVQVNPEGFLVDEIDKQIIGLLVQDSRTPFDTIAKQINVSTNNVIQRYRKLRERNVITHSTIMVDLNKLGYRAMHINFLKLESKSKMSEIRDQLLQLPNMIVLVEHIGAYDLRVEFPIADIKDVFLIDEQIHRVSGIENLDSIIQKIGPPFPISLYDKIALSSNPPTY